MKRSISLVFLLLVCLNNLAQQKTTHMKLYGVSFEQTVVTFKDQVGYKLENFAGISGCSFFVNPYVKSTTKPDIVHHVEISTPSKGLQSINDSRKIVELMLAKYGKPSHQYHQQTNATNSNKCYDMYEWMLPNGFITVKTIDIGVFDEGHIVINYYDTANIKDAFSEIIAGI